MREFLGPATLGWVLVILIDSLSIITGSITPTIWWYVAAFVISMTLVFGWVFRRKV